MTAIEKYFFTPIYYPRTGWSVLKWWESRRPLYNVCVGAAGLTSLGTATALALLPPHPLPFPLPSLSVLGGVAMYGVLANLCYTLGAPADLFLRRILGDRAAAAGPVLFRYGFVFSLGLTLLPIPLAALGWVFRFFVH
jgi:hypothetical protein